MGLTSNRMNGHRKTVRFMHQPATGWYAECSCGRLPNSPLRTNKTQAERDFQTHLTDEKRNEKRLA